LREAAEWCLEKLQEADVPVSLATRQFVDDLKARVAGAEAG